MLLNVQNLSVHYDGMQALSNVSLNVKQGEIVSILGSNGAGKTTFMNAISGLLKLTSGMIEFEGNSVLNIPAYDRVPLGIVQIPEGRRLFPLMTVEENLLLGSTHPAARKVRQESLDEVYELLPRLRERRTQIAKTLSGGEQQMLSVARTLMGNPYLVLLDEPAEGLAPVLVEQMAHMIRALKKQGVSILLSEQNLHFANLVCDRAYVIEKGQINYAGSIRSLIDNQAARVRNNQ